MVSSLPSVSVPWRWALQAFPNAELRMTDGLFSIGKDQELSGCGKIKAW
jgi:hypothetical protein